MVWYDCHFLAGFPMHGQALAEEIAKRKGEKPSPGTIYPALKNLREAGFIREENKDGKTIVYSLTQGEKVPSR